MDIGILEKMVLERVIEDTVIRGNCPMVVTEQLRNFLSNTLQYRSEDRKSALYVVYIYHCCDQL